MPFTSPLPRLEVPDKDLWEFVYENPDRSFPDDHILFVDAESKKELIYAQHRQDSLRFGQGLLERWGWNKGDVLLLLSKNDMHYASITSGVHYAGGAFTASATVVSVEMLMQSITDCNAKALVTDPAHLEQSLAAASKVGLPKDRVLLLADNGDEKTGTSSWRDIMAAENKSVPRPKLEPSKDIAYVVFTSGTTGPPKAVAKSHSAAIYEILWGLYYTRPVATAWKEIRTIATFPYYLPASYLVRGVYLYAGVQNIIVSLPLTLPLLLQTIQDYKTTLLHAAPPLLEAFALHPILDQFDLSSLKRLLTTGSTLDTELVHRVWDRLKIPMQNAFGTSEASALANTDYQHPGSGVPISSVGYISHNATFKILSRTGSELPEGRIGRLLVKYAHMAAGYLNDPSPAQLLSHDGFLPTGDFALVKDGLLFLHGRVADAIHYDDYEIRPSEIELLIKQHQFVKEVIVKAVRGEKGGNADPRAYVVLVDGVKERKGAEGLKELERELEEVVMYQAEEAYWLRGGVRFVDAIPKSPAGKILRSLLPE